MRIPTSLAAVALAAILIVSGSPSRARADEGRRCLERLTDAEVTVRLRRIERVFDRTRTESRLWYWTWLTTFAGLTTAQLYLVVNTKSPPVRTAYIFGSVGSTAATLQLLIAPFTPAFAWRRVRSIPDDTPAQRRERLALAERLLEQSARDERRLRSPYRHLAAFAYPFVTAGYLYLRYRDREIDRFGGFRLLLWGNLLGGFAIPELQTFSSPSTEIVAWEDYLYGSRPCMSPLLREPAGVEVHFTPVAFGGGVRVDF